MRSVTFQPRRLPSNSRPECQIMRGFAWLLLSIATIVLPVAKTHAEDVETSKPTTAGKIDEVAQLDQKLAEVAARISKAQAAVDTIRSREGSAAPPARMLSEIELLKYLELVYAQQQNAVEYRAELSEKRTQLADQLQTLRSVGPEETPPYSFLMVDDLRDQLSAEKARVMSLQIEIDASTGIVESIQRTFDDAERERRLAKDRLARNSDPSTERELSTSFAGAQLYSLVLAEALKWRSKEVENNKQKLAISELTVKLLEEKVALFSQSTAFTQHDLEICLERLARDEQDIQRAMKSTRDELKDIERNWIDARQRLAKATGDKSLLEAEVDAWRIARESRQQQINMFSQRLGELVVMRFIWTHRFQVVNNKVSPDEMLTWQEETVEYRNRMESAQQVIDTRMGEARIDLATLEKQQASAQETNPELARWDEMRVRELQRLLAAYGSNLVRVSNARRLLDKYTNELSEETQPESATQLLTTTSHWLKTCWNYELTSIDDQPITVSKIVGGLILMLLGYVFSRAISRLIGRRILPRFGMNDGVSTAIQTIAFYFLVASFGFVSLELINIPLTVFTFMGGAVAIGVGFGSQNVLNNFISGLILLAERPIRVGDLVDIDGLYGTIEHIGARSTRVRTGSNLEIIVPNSKLLENNVTNWTLSDTRIRTSVNVGVSYGSPTRQVENLLRDALHDNSKILAEPEPIILFTEFGDNSLNFEVHFWIHMRTMMDGRRVESEVRHTIDRLCRQADISIAFPQRDVHLDSAAPIEVNLVGLSGAKSADDLLRARAA